jgi:hypothetical protein
MPLKQNFTNMMTQLKPKGICSVDYTMSLDLKMSLELPNDMFIKFFAQHVINVAHVDVSMNLSMRQQMSNNLKNI